MVIRKLNQEEPWNLIYTEDDDASTSLAIRPTTPADEALRLQLHPLKTGDGLLVKVLPPKQPVDRGLHHVPCDIVLVIDVSGSMAWEARVPGRPGEVRERHGLSILDLTKHAARTILSTLNEGDRLGIVTFSSQATVLQQLVPMTVANKALAEKNIASMEPKDATNLWQGLLRGIKVFGDAEPMHGRAAAMMVLTDGQPNFMCPRQGYIPKLRNMRLPATINTFGFGYSLKSGLLKSIAEVSHGNYAFIPEAGMIGTVFVHAVANLQSTFANDATLTLTYPGNITLEGTAGKMVGQDGPIEIPFPGQLPGHFPTGVTDDYTRKLVIHLGDIQYGHTRDILLRCQHSADESLSQIAPVVDAVLTYKRMTPEQHRVNVKSNILTTTTTSISDAEIAYHAARHKLLAFLTSLFPIQSDGEHLAVADISDDIRRQLDDLTSYFEELRRNYEGDPRCKSLIGDLYGPDQSQGQILLALEREYWPKWGMHYLPSLTNAHQRQICNSFKDPGPMMYSTESPLFIKCRDRLDAAFDNLPAPQPSVIIATNLPHSSLNMAAYNDSANPCFAGCSKVLLAIGESPGIAGANAKTGHARGRWIRIGRLRKGMSVQTPKGPRRVAAVLKTEVRKQTMCLIDGMLVTPWHPVSLDGTSWVFPTHVSRRKARYTGPIFSILLDRDVEVDAHAVMVGRVWGVTLGHGLLEDAQDARAHHFFGDYSLVEKALAGLRTGKHGVVTGAGVTREGRTGLVNGFRRVSSITVGSLLV